MCECPVPSQEKDFCNGTDIRCVSTFIVYMVLLSILGMSNISNVMLRERGEVAEWARDVMAMEYG